jgi:hypothetical protein
MQLSNAAKTAPRVFISGQNPANTQTTNPEAINKKPKQPPVTPDKTK